MADPTAGDRIRHVLLATDFSDSADAGRAWAASIARAHAAHVTVLHVINDLPDTNDARGRGAAVDAKLAGIVDALWQDDIEASAERRYDPPWRGIVGAAADRGTNIIIQGVRGQGLFPLAPLGHTAERVARTTSVPVLTVPPAPKSPPAGPVLVATDFGPEAALALAAARSLLAIWREPVPLLLLHVRTAESGDGAEAKLDALAAEAGAAETVVRDGDAARVIRDVARERDARLVALGTRGADARTVRLGRTTLWTLNHATCPVLTVRRP